MKKFYNSYLNSSISYEKWQLFGISCLLIVFSGFFGWVYEFIFYYFNFGMKDFYWQGGNFLPWINIYAIGAIMIYLLCRKLKKHPILIFWIAFFSTGLLEYLSGFIIYHFFDGLRLWNYNTEILNFGNIDGFVCFRSVLFFGISGLLLMYGILPVLCYLSKHMNKRIFLILSIGLCSLILFDEVYNFIIARVFHLPRARNIYTKLGIKYMKYR
ncbi:MAG: putative ABC transporter permease [Bacilli bacterium]|nr:putative ABC transporter permease [Bacilli bacterium]